MKIIDLLKEKQRSNRDAKPITIVFIGDSITQGCFECYLTSPDSLENVFDYKSAYSTRVKEILNMLYPSVQINIINSGIAGDSAEGGWNRFERDVLAYNPDLVVISFGLNDAACGGAEGKTVYTKALANMFASLKGKNIDTLFLTENVMNTHVSPHLCDKMFIDLAERFALIQNNGLVMEYFEAAKSVCAEYGVKVCDFYSVWERALSIGINTTELLANKLNHPVRELHYYIATKIVEAILF